MLWLVPLAVSTWLLHPLRPECGHWLAHWTWSLQDGCRKTYLQSDMSQKMTKYGLFCQISITVYSLILKNKWHCKCHVHVSVRESSHSTGFALGTSPERSFVQFSWAFGLRVESFFTLLCSENHSSTCLCALHKTSQQHCEATSSRVSARSKSCCSVSNSSVPVKLKKREKQGTSIAI